jgi:hypothetical protein
VAYEIPGFKIGTLRAGSDLSAKQFCFVKLNASGQVVACAAVTDVPLGILQNTPGSLAVADVMTNGVSKLVGSGSIPAASMIGTDNAGKAAAYVPGTDTTKYIVGQALEGNTSANGLITVAFNCLNPARGA